MELYFIAIWKMALAAPTNLECSIMVSIYYRSTYPALEQKKIDDSNGQKDFALSEMDTMYGHILISKDE